MLHLYQNKGLNKGPIMNYRLPAIVGTTMFFCSLSLISKAPPPLEQACNTYLQTSPRAPEKLTTCLRYIQNNNLPSRTRVLTTLLDELYAADITLLNALHRLATHGTPPLSLFPENLTATAKNIYRQAEMLISK